MRHVLSSVEEAYKYTESRRTDLNILDNAVRIILRRKRRLTHRDNAKPPLLFRTLSLSFSATSLSCARLIDDRLHTSRLSQLAEILSRDCARHNNGAADKRNGYKEHVDGKTEVKLTTDAQSSPSGLPLRTLLAHLSRSPAPPPSPPPPSLCASSCAAMIFLDRTLSRYLLFFPLLLQRERPSTDRDRHRAMNPSRTRFADYLGGSIANPNRQSFRRNQEG